MEGRNGSITQIPILTMPNDGMLSIEIYAWLWFIFKMYTFGFSIVGVNEDNAFTDTLRMPYLIKCVILQCHMLSSRGVFIFLLRVLPSLLAYSTKMNTIVSLCSTKNCG